MGRCCGMSTAQASRSAHCPSTLLAASHLIVFRPQATPAQFIEYLAAELFQSCVNERLFKLSRQDDPPFYVAQVL